MSLTFFEKAALAISGLTALGIGNLFLTQPRAFFSSYGVTLGENASLLSELRAPAACLVAFGGLMLAGIWLRSLAPISKAAALTVFLAFPTGRITGLLIDGWPSGSILGALLFELAVAALCIVAFGLRFEPAAVPPSGARAEG